MDHQTNGEPQTLDVPKIMSQRHFNGIPIHTMPDDDVEARSNAKNSLLIGGGGSVILVILLALLMNGKMTLAGNIDPSLMSHFEARVTYVLTNLIFPIFSIFSAWIYFLFQSYNKRVSPIECEEDTGKLSWMKTGLVYLMGQFVLTSGSLIMSAATIRDAFILITTPLVSYSFPIATLLFIVGMPKWQNATIPLFLLPQLLLIGVSLKAFS